MIRDCASTAPKIFCIGLQKTGTTSLEIALRKLGYRVCGEVGGYRADLTRRERIEDALRKSARFDAFNDFPWNILYRELDAAFPGSKFILTVRDKDRWIRSCSRHYATLKRPALKTVFGAPTPKENERRFKDALTRHNDEARAYFQGRPEDFLAMNLEAGDSWSELCGFLNQPQPDEPFPIGFRGDSLRIRVWRSIIGVMKNFSYDLTRVRRQSRSLR